MVISLPDNYAVHQNCQEPTNFGCVGLLLGKGDGVAMAKDIDGAEEGVETGRQGKHFFKNKFINYYIKKELICF